MPPISIRSSALAGIAYDAVAERLEIQFHDGRTYEYEEIPPDVHAALVAAESKGRYFNAAIRHRFPGRPGKARNLAP